MAYTIKDIANKLGVSITTVSLIVNDRPCRVSAETRQAVLSLVKEYKYTPNSAARALITKRTQTIGLIVPDISNPFFAELAKGVQKEAQRNGYSVIFCNSDNSGSKDTKNTALLVSKQIDGLVIVPSFTEQEVQEVQNFNKIVEEEKLSVVFADRAIPLTMGFFHGVLTNHQLGGYLATEHLLKLGHSRVGCITGPNVDSSRQRFAGYKQALQGKGIELDKSLLFAGDYMSESGEEGMKVLLEKGVTAVFACNDMMALGCLRQLRRAKLLPGRDISVVGFDDISLCEFLDIPLTTVNQSLYNVGKHAFRLIADLIEKPSLPQNIVMLAPQLVVRSTTAPPST